MRQQKADRSGVDTLRNHFIGKLIPGVGTWGELDVLRGWKDDFFGDVIADQYTAASNGAGSGGTLLFAHGGFYQLTAGAGAGFYHHLWLGNSAAGVATLDADSGWISMARFSVGSTTNIAADFGSNSTAAMSDFIMAGANTFLLPNNWCLAARTGGGAITIVDTGIAIDNTAAHWHVLNVYPIAGGLRQADYYLDGALVATTTVAVPIAVLTPFIRCHAAGAAVRNMYLDFWAVIPRNLV